MLYLPQIGDSNQLVIGFGDGNIKLYAIGLHQPNHDNASFTLRQAFEQKHSSHVYSLIRFNNGHGQDNNTVVASASYDHNIIIWSRQAKSKENMYPEFKFETTLDTGHSSHVSKLVDLSTFQANFMMASCSADGTIIVWQMDENKKFVKKKILLNDKSVSGLETLMYVSSQREFISAYYDRSKGHSLIHIWSLNQSVGSEFEDKEIIQIKSNVWSLLELMKDSSDDGVLRMVSGHQNGSICLWVKKRHQASDKYELCQTINEDDSQRDQHQHKSEVRSLLELENNHDLVSGSLFKIIIYGLDVSKGEFYLKQTLNKHECNVWCLVDLLANKEKSGQEGKALFISGSDDKTLKIWSN
jgi:hypothetical protein